MDPSQSRYLHEARDVVPLSITTDATLSAFDTELAVKKAAARVVCARVTDRADRLEILRALFHPHRPGQLPPDQRGGQYS